MLIGGQDIIIELQSPLESALEIAVRTIRIHWPHAVYIKIDIDQDERVYPLLHEIPFGQTKELFIHQDEKGRQAWDNWQEDQKESSQAIYLISKPNEITLVCDQENFPTALVEDIKSNLLYAQSFCP